MLQVDVQSAVCCVPPYDTVIDFVAAEMYRARRATALVEAEGIVIESATGCGASAGPLPPGGAEVTGGRLELLLPPPPPPQAASTATATTEQQSLSACKRGLIGETPTR